MGSRQRKIIGRHFSKYWAETKLEATRMLIEETRLSGLRREETVSGRILNDSGVPEWASRVEMKRVLFIYYKVIAYEEGA